ncbi:transglycosylase SLT domain-containing protein [Agaribacterium sp. ZY112]|uniref:transglycosylase SLT domain-containing protein n=1 Tax=Agaribacterium sp. ZY112 TaxID=3233574 RepID=UPI003523F068
MNLESFYSTMLKVHSVNKTCLAHFCFSASLFRFIKVITLIVFVFIFSACTTAPPKNKDNICDIFDEKSGWYKDAKKASKRWGVPISVNMAFMHQESRFVAKAKPPRKKYLGFIPGPRLSSAYGYSQAKDSTWDWYKDSAPHWGADRDDFDDAIDFVAWYNHLSSKKLGIRTNDAYSLYLAYHEGMGGYSRKTYNKKPWLKDVAKKVSRRANNYSAQLKKCEKRLNSGWWFF